MFVLSCVDDTDDAHELSECEDVDFSPTAMYDDVFELRRLDLEERELERELELHPELELELLALEDEAEVDDEGS